METAIEIKTKEIKPGSNLDKIRQMYASGFSVLDIAFTIHKSPQNVYKQIRKYNLKRSTEGVDN